MKMERCKKAALKTAIVIGAIAMFCLTFFAEPVRAATVKLNTTEKKMVIGNTYKLKVRNTQKSVKWRSSNPKVATVSKNGLVTAKKAGKTTITAKVGKKKFTCKVTVITMQDSYVSKTIRQMNKERRKYGYASFDRDPLLMAAAQKRAKELSKKFSHTRPNGTKWTSAISMDYDFKRAAENIARDFATPQQTVDAWMKSASTKAKIIGKQYKDIGVGVYLGKDGYLYWCAIFAREK
ncbi:MAG: Ig-like domain-containing protein [Lachnospiraceae bacterium]|nr:Ig-like domain-containing protein [Lachnospiraceae bacterium]